MRTTPPHAEEHASSTRATFTSKLKGPRERFLASVVEHALTIGRRTAEDFLRAFPPGQITRALDAAPKLRAQILVAATGLHEKVALKKSAESAGEDLDLALSEGIVDAAKIVSLFDPDDRVRYLDHARLWAFVAEGEFWRVTSDVTTTTAQEHIAFILERGRTEKLLSDRDIVDGVGIDVLAEGLPHDALAELMNLALAEGRAGRPFKDEGVLQIVPPARLVEHVSLAHLWHRVIAKKLAFDLEEPDNTRVSIEVMDDDEAAAIEAIDDSTVTPNPEGARTGPPTSFEMEDDLVTVASEPSGTTPLRPAR